MGLPKAFDYVHHNLLLVKLLAKNVDENILCYIHTYLPNRKHCMGINNSNNELLNLISGIPQGSTAELNIFNYFFNDFSYFTETANAHNLANDDTLKFILKLL